MMWRPVLALLLAACAAAPAAVPSKHLFVDRQLFSNVSAGIGLRLHRPHRASQHAGGRVLVPEFPAPTGSFQGYGAYSGLMAAGDGGYVLPDKTIRMYYACHTTKPGGNKTVGGICLAVSRDGLNWRAWSGPGVQWNGSTDNNCVLLGASGSIFYDTNPAAPEWERYKFVGTATNPASGLAGSYAAASPTGLGNWTFLSTTPALNVSVVPEGLSDTCDTGWWDSALQSYVLYVRMDCHSGDTKGPKPACSPTGQKRRWEIFGGGNACRS